MAEFENLKTRQEKISIFKDELMPVNFSRSPGTSSSVTKSNEASRLVRCRHCGWICDLERDINLKDQSMAGLGVVYTDATTGTEKYNTDNQIKLSTT